MILIHEVSFYCLCTQHILCILVFFLKNIYDLSSYVVQILAQNNEILLYAAHIFSILVIFVILTDTFQVLVNTF